MKKKLLFVVASVMMVTLALVGAVGAQALPKLQALGMEDPQAVGTVEELEAEYLVVDGVRYEITVDTELATDIQIGDLVKVEYVEDGELFNALTVDFVEEFEIIGTVEELDVDYLVVDGVRYELTTNTEIASEIATGDLVKVTYYEDGELNVALNVELVEIFEITGTVDDLSMDFLVVDGLSYMIMPGSEIEEGIQIGDTVKVKYYEDTESQLIILEAELEDEDEDMDDDYNQGAVCSGEAIHPVLNSLAMSYDVSYEELLPYFCEQNLGVGEIKHALETAQLDSVDMTWQEILAMRSGENDMNDLGWGEIWQDLGLIGKDKNDEDQTVETQEQQEVQTNHGKSDQSHGNSKDKDKGH